MRIQMLGIGLLTAGLSLGLTPLLAHGQDAVLTESFIEGLSGYEPSYIGQELIGDPHTAFQISLKYPLFTFDLFGAGATDPFVGYRSGFYLAYTGRYEFYTSRTSSPVITREFNPGFLFDFQHCYDQPLNLGLGYFHDSNGQTVDTLEEYQAIPEHAQDYVSRGWDYVLIKGSYALDAWIREIGSNAPAAMETHVNLRLQSMLFLNRQGLGKYDKEEDDFWSGTSSQPKRSDYDGLRFEVLYQNPLFRVIETIRSGYTAFNLSSETTVTVRPHKWFPISLRYYTGYGPDLSAYQMYSQSLMLCLDLIDYQPQ